MLSAVVSVTLYDTLGENSTQSIINEAELETIICSSAHLGVLAQLKLKGVVDSLKTLIYNEGPIGSKTLAKDLEKAAEAGLQVVSFKEAVEKGQEYLS